MATTIEDARKELDAAGIKYTHKDYMDSVVDHQTYFRQFVNKAVMNLVISVIGKDKILASTDKHFNDIPLAKWDALSGGYNASIPTSRLLSLSNMFTQSPERAVPFISLSDCVCTLKAAAAMIREGATL